MEEKRLLLGDEALALAALHAGLTGVYAYPGTPSTEITEFIQNHPLTRERGIHCDWSCNEKTAMEGALGVSYAGKRALVCMKHVGMNVCADAFVNAGMTGANGGLVVAAVGAGIMGTKYGEASDKYGDVKDGDKRALKKFDENDAYVHVGIGLLAGGIGLGIAGSAVAIYSAVKQNNIRDSNPDVFDPDSVEPEITAPAASNTDIDFRFDVSPNSVVFGMTF